MAIDIQRLFNVDLPAGIARYPDQVKAIGAKYQFNITGDGGGEWLIDASDSGPSCTPGQGPNPDVTITLAVEDFQKLQEDPQANSMALFSAGKITIAGNLMLARNLPKLLTISP